MQKRETALNAIAFGLLFLYLNLAAASFPAFVEPSLRGVSIWRVDADSTKYMIIASYVHAGGGSAALIVGLLSLARNLLLPILVALTLKTDLQIALFNMSLFFGAMWIISKGCSKFRWYFFIPAVLASPTTFEALLTLNKEIFTLLSAALFVYWVCTRSRFVMMTLLILSACLRWEQAFAIGCFILLLRLRARPKAAIPLLIAGISIVYPIAIAYVSRGVAEEAIESSSSTLYAHINVLQNHGLYFLLILPKLAIALLSQVVRFWAPFYDPTRLHDLPTGPFVLIDQICMCIVFLVALCKKLWNTENTIAYFVIIYCIVFLAAPENSPRYLYMVYILTAAMIASPDLQVIKPFEKARKSNGSRIFVRRLRTFRLPVRSREYRTDLEASVGGSESVRIRGRLDGEIVA